MKKDEISGKHWIEKSNVLNGLKANGMKLTEIRFLAIYQSKINARNPESREVSFTLNEFMRILDLKQVNVVQLKQIADDIICKPVHIPNKYNGFIAVPLFSKCEVLQNPDTLEWSVRIKCSEEVMPYMFEMKKNYFKYQLWNALSLSSVNQIRMYELLKQYEKIGKRTISIEDLKAMLGIDSNQYARFGDFKNYVLDACQSALEQNTDIKYTYETIKGARGKVLSIVFNITKNSNFKDNLRLKEFINSEDLEDINNIDYSAVESLYYRCDEAYTIEQLKTMIDCVENSGVKLNIGIENYIYSIYANIKVKDKKINNLFKYTLGTIKKQLDEHVFTSNNQKEDKKPKEKHFDSSVIEDFKDLIHTTERYMGEDNTTKKKTKNIKKSAPVNDDAQKLPVIDFKFFFDRELTDYVSFDCCRRLQALLEQKYHKDDTFWLFEEPFTQEQIIELTLEKHQVIVKPKKNELNQKL